ncbi:uncharacterized protein LOC144109701 [Amblyomma americanum]
MNPPRSGTEEEYEEKEKLLQEISDLAREFRYKCKSRKAQAAANKTFATGVRDNACAAAARVSPHHSDSYPTPSGTANDTPETASYVLQQMCSDRDVVDDYFTTDAENFQSAQQTASANVTTDVQEETEEHEPQPTAEMKRRKRKPKTAGDENHEFLEKRWSHERAMKEKDMQLEMERAALEKVRLEIKQRRYEKRQQMKSIKMENEFKLRELELEARANEVQARR